MSGIAPTLPPQVRVFVRDWLSSNNILLKGREGHVLIDSGYARHAPLTLALLATPQGIGAAPLARLVNTHCHSDHMGGNAAIKARYGCPIALPDGEAPLIDAWDENTLLLAYADQRADRFAYDEVIRAGETHVWGDLEWQALAAPGHDMGALVFFNPEHRILVSGDALWANGYGFVMPREVDPRALPESQRDPAGIRCGQIVADRDFVVPGLGDPNVPASSSVYAFDVSVPTAAKLKHVIKTGPLVGESANGIAAYSGSHPNRLHRRQLVGRAE